MSYRIVFMGTPLLAARTLESLILAGADVVLVVTTPDKTSGRKLAKQPSPVKKIALAHKIAILQPASAKEQNFAQQLRAVDPDVALVCALWSNITGGDLKNSALWLL